MKLKSFSSRILRQFFHLQKMGVSFGKSMNISKKIIEFITWLMPKLYSADVVSQLDCKFGLDRLTTSQIVCELCYTKASAIWETRMPPWVRALYIMAKYGCFLHQAFCYQLQSARVHLQGAIVCNQEKLKFSIIRIKFFEYRS